MSGERRHSTLVGCVEAIPLTYNVVAVSRVEAIGSHHAV